MFQRVSVIGILVLIACGGPSLEKNNGRTGDSCDSSLDCADGILCIQQPDASAGECIVPCGLNVDECGAEAYCNQVGSLAIGVCDDEAEDSGGDVSSGTTDSAEEQAETEDRYVPCTSDDECSAFESGSICATHQGISECTIPCSAESDCDVPSVGGVTIDFMTCQPDEGPEDRNACVLDQDCFTDPMSCIDLGDFPGGDDFPGGGF